MASVQADSIGKECEGAGFGYKYKVSLSLRLVIGILPWHDKSYIQKDFTHTSYDPH